jgi:hypothetical protein
VPSVSFDLDRAFHPLFSPASQCFYL